MATIEEVQAALEQTRELVEDLEKQLHEKEVTLANIEGEFVTKESNLNQKWKAKLEQQNADWEKKAAQVASQRDMVLQAVEGDPCGWVEKVDPGGATYYENSDTGEMLSEKPQVLQIAELVKSAQQGASDKAQVLRANKKARDAETRFRKCEIQLADANAEVKNLKEVLARWIEAGGVVSTNLSTFQQALDKQVKKVLSKVDGMPKKQQKVVDATVSARKATDQFVHLHETIADWEERYRQLSLEHEQLQEAHEKALQTIKTFEENMQEEIDRRIIPLHNELAETCTSLMKEKALREQDLSDICLLWPEGFLMPSILLPYSRRGFGPGVIGSTGVADIMNRDAEGGRQGTPMVGPHKPLTEAERLEKQKEAHVRDGQNAVQMEIRAKIREARKWVAQMNEHGQTFYVNKETGESTWDVPEEMQYHPPSGYDEEGNRLRPTLEKDNSAASHAASFMPEVPWVRMESAEGHVYYESKLSGKQTWEVPPGFIEKDGQ